MRQKVEVKGLLQYKIFLIVQEEDVRKPSLWRTEDFKMENESWVEGQVKKTGSVAWGLIGHKEAGHGPDGADGEVVGLTKKVN